MNEYLVEKAIIKVFLWGEGGNGLIRNACEPVLQEYEACLSPEVPYIHPLIH